MSSPFRDRESGIGNRVSERGPAPPPCHGVSPAAERIALALPALCLAALVAVAHPRQAARAVASLLKIEEAQALPSSSASLATPATPAAADSRFPVPDSRSPIPESRVPSPDSLSASKALRVCADPNNLPFSNDRGEGFENAIAALVARELGAHVEYTWWAQRRGFVRNTLRARLCDVTVGAPAHMEMLLTTHPYYRSTYVFVTRRDRHLGIRDFDDPRLRTLKVGVPLIGDDYANPPPVEALTRRGAVRNLVGFTVYGDYRQPNPPTRILDAVAKGTVDVAVVWGPLAGWFARHEPVPLDVTPTPPADGPARPLTFDIAMGVRDGDQALRARLDSVIVRRGATIDSILRAYGVPRADRRPAPDRTEE